MQHIKVPILCVHVHAAFLLSILQWSDQVPHVGWLIAHIGQASSPVTALQVLQSTDEALATIHFAKSYHQITCLYYKSQAIRKSCHSWNSYMRCVFCTSQKGMRSFCTALKELSAGYNERKLLCNKREVNLCWQRWFNFFATATCKHKV